MPSYSIFPYTADTTFCLWPSFAFNQLWMGFQYFCPHFAYTNVSLIGVHFPVNLNFLGVVHISRKTGICVLFSTFPTNQIFIDFWPQSTKTALFIYIHPYSLNKLFKHFYPPSYKEIVFLYCSHSRLQRSFNFNLYRISENEHFINIFKQSLHYIFILLRPIKNTLLSHNVGQAPIKKS